MTKREYRYHSLSKFQYFRFTDGVLSAREGTKLYNFLKGYCDLHPQKFQFIDRDGNITKSATSGEPVTITLTPNNHL